MIKTTMAQVSNFANSFDRTRKTSFSRRSPVRSQSQAHQRAQRDEEDSDLAIIENVIGSTKSTVFRNGDFTTYYYM